VTTFEDPDRGVIQIVPSHNEHGHVSTIPGARNSKVKTAKKAKIARPANAFILYRQHHHPLVKSQHPDIHNNQICTYHVPDGDLLLTCLSNNTWGPVEGGKPEHESSIHQYGQATKGQASS